MENYKQQFGVARLIKYSLDIENISMSILHKTMNHTIKPLVDI